MHILPGRIRIRFREIKNRVLSEQLEELLNQTEGIFQAQVNPYTGGCLVIFATGIPPETMVDTLLIEFNIGIKVSKKKPQV